MSDRKSHQTGTTTVTSGRRGCVVDKDGNDVTHKFFPKFEDKSPTWEYMGFRSDAEYKKWIKDSFSFMFNKDGSYKGRG